MFASEMAEIGPMICEISVLSSESHVVAVVVGQGHALWLLFVSSRASSQVLTDLHVDLMQHTVTQLILRS